jgi:16S rRNA (guanine527-N7)-methyltransferase
MDRLARWSLPLVRPDGLLLAMKGSSAAVELHSAMPVIHRLGGATAVIQSVGAEWVDPPVTVVRVQRSTSR